MELKETDDVALIFCLIVPSHSRSDGSLDNIMGQVWREKGDPENQWRASYRFRYNTSGSDDPFANDEKTGYGLEIRDQTRDQACKNFLVPFKIIEDKSGGDLTVLRFTEEQGVDEVLKELAKQDFCTIRVENPGYENN